MITLNGILLSAELQWTDEWTAQGVAQTVRRALDGSPVIFYAGLAMGRAITLESAADAGWLTRTQVEALAVLAESPGAIYPLLLRGQSHAVMFRHQEAPAFEARPLVPLANPQAGDFYLVTLKLMTV